MPCQEWAARDEARAGGLRQAFAGPARAGTDCPCSFYPKGAKASQSSAFQPASVISALWKLPEFSVYTVKMK